MDPYFCSAQNTPHKLRLTFPLFASLIAHRLQQIRWLYPTLHQSAPAVCLTVKNKYTINSPSHRRPCGPTDKASDYGSGDSRFESWQGRFFSIFVFISLHFFCCINFTFLTNHFSLYNSTWESVQYETIPTLQLLYACVNHLNHQIVIHQL